jgi:mycothiol synthase
LRDATAADSAEISELLNAIVVGYYGEPEFTGKEVESWFAHDELDVVVAERDGALVGYADRWREKQRHRAWFDLGIPPGEAETAGTLLREIEARAAPDVDPGALAMTWVKEVDSTMRGAVEAAGYELLRHSFRMRTELDGDAGPVEWPDEIRVTTFEPSHEAAVHAAHQEAFADHWEFVFEPLDQWRKWYVENPGFDPSLWFLAWYGDELAGISLCRVHSSGDAEHGFVSILAVRKPWRRKGLGLALLRHSFAEMRRRGMKRASLGVDAENTTGAVRLYERAGMFVERRYDLYRKAL